MIAQRDHCYKLQAVHKLACDMTAAYAALDEIVFKLTELIIS